MRIHILQHESFESPAIIEDWIRNKKHKLSFTKFYEDGLLPDIKKVDWLIIMGGPMSANDEDKFPWLKEEKVFIKKAIDGNKRVLGICLGSQLIASSLGCRVYRNKFKEIGWMTVGLTESAKDNYIFRSLPGTISVCQWHGETFDMPEGAVHIARSEACGNQAFIYKERVVGLQFHLEFTEDTLKDLIKNAGKELVKDKYVQTEDEIMGNLHLLKPANNLLSELMDRMDGDI